MPETEHDSLMEEWGAWLEKHGADVAEPGLPFGARTALDGAGEERVASPLSGYSIVRADSLEAASELCRDHPFLSDGGEAHAVEIFELVPI